MIFNVQKCSIHDGHGLRTLVFFKGCPLRCKWCANPESQEYYPEIMESPSKCIGCGACMEICPKNAISIEEDGPRIDRNECNNCLKCAEVCYAGSKYQVGEDYDIEELYKLIERDSIFYSIKGGGVTFSGGEPLNHARYLTEIARTCHERGIDVAIESCGSGNFSEFKHALPYINSAFFDIKHIDKEQHKEITGAGNELILDNIRRAAESGLKITIRTPIIPGLNNTIENIRGIAEFVSTLPNVTEYELLAYHQFGENKYNALGRSYELAGVEPPADEEMRSLVKCANEVFGDNGRTCFYTRDNNKEIVR